MERKAVGFEQLSDIFGFRVVVGNVTECYQALGIVHISWPVVPGRFKDYISTPKRNRYRSIHTTVIGPGEQHVELQIRPATYDGSPNTTTPPTRSTRMVSVSDRDVVAGYQRLRLAAAHHRASRRRLQPGRIFRAHQTRIVPRPGVLLHAEGRLDRVAARRHADRLLCAIIPTSAIWRSARISTARSGPLSSPLQNGDEVQILTSKAQTAPPAAWPEIQRGDRQGARRHPPRHPRGGARPNWRSAGASSSGCASAPRSNIPTRSSKAR